MTKMTKTLLVLAAVNLVAGLIFAANLIDVHNASVLYITLPAGAIFFGLFLISRLLEKEIAFYDEEHQHIPAAARGLQAEQTSHSPSVTHQPLAKPHSA